MKKIHPLFIAYVVIIVLSLLIASSTGSMSPMVLMDKFMGVAFLVFALLKVINLKGFITDFKQYDFLAKRFPVYATLYPFVELFIGTWFLVFGSNLIILTIALFLVLFNLVTLYGSFKDGVSVLCVCLGKRLAFPFDKWLILENLFMLFMMVYMIIMFLPGGESMNHNIQSTPNGHDMNNMGDMQM